MSCLFVLFLSVVQPVFAEQQNDPMANREVSLDKIVFQPSKGLSIVSDDGEFKMVTRFRAQQLYTLEKSDEMSHSFQIRRARVTFQGHVFGKENTYKFELAISPRDIGLKSQSVSKSPLLDCYFQFNQIRDLNIRMGQYKVPYSRQRVVSSGDLQMVDRSIVNSEFNLDRDLGLDLRSKDFLGLKKMRYYAGIYMGEGHSSYENGDFGMMYLTRIEYLPLGFYQDYKEGDLEKNTTAKMSIGIAFAKIDEAKKDKGILGSTPLDGGTTDTLNATADINMKYAGWSFDGAFFWREGERNTGSTTDETGVAIPEQPPRNGIGYSVQSGYIFPNTNVEFSSRYAQILPEDDKSSLSTSHEAGLGLSNYIGEHSLKIQSDFFRFWSDDGFSEGDNQFRVQVQLAY